MSLLPDNIRKAIAGALSNRKNNRDFDAVFGYTKNPSYWDLYDMYQRQGIPKRIVNAPADAIWASPPTVLGNDAFNDAWSDLILRFDVYKVLNRLDRLAGIGKFSLLVAGFDDSGALDSPLGAATSLLYLQPYSEGSIKIKAYNDDPTSPRYGKPELYEVDPNKLNNQDNQVVGTATQNKRAFSKFTVHATRCIHVAEDTLENDVFGNSRLRSVYNLLEDLRKITGGASEGFWLTVNRGLHIDIDKDLDLAPEDEEGLADEVEDYENRLSRVLRTRGVKVTSLGSDTPSPKDAYEVILSSISGSTGIPKRILSGAEAGQLASSQDRANWADRIDERRTLFAEPTIFYPFIRLMATAGILPASDINVAWPNAFKMSPLEKNQAQAQQARSASNVVKAMVSWDKAKQEEGSTLNGEILSTDEGREILGIVVENPKFDETQDVAVEPTTD